MGEPAKRATLGMREENRRLARTAANSLNRHCNVIHLGAMVALLCFTGGIAFGQDSKLTRQSIDGGLPLVYVKNRIASSEIEKRRDALFEIRNLRSEQASRLAIPALTDTSEIVRATAASSVTYLPANEAADLLLPLLNDKAEFVRREAAHALGKIGSSKATGPLLRILQKDKALEVRNASVVALGEIGDMSAVEALAAILNKKPKEDDEFLRRSAARAIGEIAQIIQSGKVKVLTPQNFLPDKFKELEPPKYPNLTGQFPVFRLVVTVLTKVLKNRSESGDTRREAAFSLGSIGDVSAVSVLRSNLDGPDPYLSEISKEALLKFKKPE